MRFRCCGFLLLSFVALGWAARCDPPGRIAELIQTLPERPNEHRAALARHLEAAPEDFWLNRLLLEASLLNHTAIREKYRQRFEAHPEKVCGILDAGSSQARKVAKRTMKRVREVIEPCLEGSNGDVAELENLSW